MKAAAIFCLLYASAAFAATGYLVGSSITNVNGFPYLQCDYNVNGATMSTLRSISGTCPLTIDV